MFILIIIINLCEVVDDSILIGFAGGHVSRGPTHEALVRAARDPVTDLATIFKLSNLSIYSMTHFVILTIALRVRVCTVCIRSDEIPVLGLVQLVTEP